MPRKHHASLESFGPELFLFWQKAVNARVSVRCHNHARAVKLRQRLYSLRAAMRAHDHPDASSADRVSLSIEEDSLGNWCLHGAPVDSEYTEAFQAAGIEVPDAPSLDDIFLDLDLGDKESD